MTNESSFPFDFSIAARMSYQDSICIPSMETTSSPTANEVFDAGEFSKISPI